MEILSKCQETLFDPIREMKHDKHAKLLKHAKLRNTRFPEAWTCDPIRV